MNCGYDCPCCSGSGDCETCDAMMIYEDNWKNTIVEGAYQGGIWDGFTIPDYNGDRSHSGAKHSKFIWSLNHD